MLVMSVSASTVSFQPPADRRKASPRQAAYYSIVQPYVRGDARLPRSRLGAVLRLVSVPYLVVTNLFTPLKRDCDTERLVVS